MTLLSKSAPNEISFFDRYFTELKAIIILAVPLIITQMGVTAVGFIDTMMAGHYSKSALAGAAVGSSVFFPFVFAINGIMMAVTPITAHLKGAGKEKEAVDVVNQSLWIAIFFSFLLITILNNVEFLLNIIDLSDEVSLIVQRYLFGVSLGIPATAAYAVLRSFVEGLGNTRPQMVISFITVVFNYFANDILIYGKFGFPELGGAGCGFASGLTFWVFLISILIYMFFNKECRRLKAFSGLSYPSLSGVKDVLKLGLPIGGTLFMECSIFACITLFIGALGPVMVGGHQITLNFSALIFALPLSIGMAVTIRAGLALGAKDGESARFSCFTGTSFAVVVSIFTMVITIFFPGVIAGLYTKDPDITAVSVSLLKIAALYQISDAIMITSQSALRGYKDANMTFALTFTAYWLITLPLGYLISMTDFIVPAMGAKGFWISLIVGLTTSGIFLFIRLNNVSKKYLRD